MICTGVTAIVRHLQRLAGDEEEFWRERKGFAFLNYFVVCECRKCYKRDPQTEGAGGGLI